MSYALSEEQSLIQQVAREFAQEYVEPLAVEIDLKDEHPAELLQNMGEHDFLGLFIPSEYGGADSDYLSYVLAVEEISRLSGSVGSILINHSSLAVYAINRWGSGQQKENYLPGMCQGKNIGSFAYAETGAAPGVGSAKLVATQEGNGYVLNGRKSYVANGGVADIYVVVALTDPEAGMKGMSAFIVDATTPGLSVGRKIEKMGLRGCQSTELIFDNVQVTKENLLGAENQGQAIIAEAYAVAAVAKGAQVVGITQAALEDAVKYSQQRVQFRRPISNFPAVQAMLARIATNLHMTRLAVYHAAGLIDKGEPFAYEAAIIKNFVSEIGHSSLIEAIQVEGGYGYSRDMPVSRLFRDLKGTMIAETSEEYPIKTIAAGLLA
ncbi:acyl-CoA dehydrogenase family protein [Dehalobacter sp. DCM]|uniref:acyl-CoA dehydrogenase family protein n=1 Tax=Dehalobacter sp. DCM TaxID=2907827 RepID=UPI00308157CF|nr:acyl-CoA dehydrogenase family protein [Dehalobacter sp. DCM]